MKKRPKPLNSNIPLRQRRKTKAKPKSLFKTFSPLFLNNEIERFLEPFHENSGISVSEDEKNIYVEAALPGISLEEIEIRLENGTLCIKADKKEEKNDKEKTFYQRALQSFFYEVSLPKNFDETKTPKASCNDGVLKIIFPKCNKKSRRKKT